MKYNNKDFSNDLSVNKHRVYCDLLFIGRRYALDYLSNKGTDNATLPIPLLLDGDKGTICITKVEKCEDMNRKGSYFAKLYDKDGNDYILYQLGSKNLMNALRAFKGLAKC